MAVPKTVVVDSSERCAPVWAWRSFSATATGLYAERVCRETGAGSCVSSSWSSKSLRSPAASASFRKREQVVAPLSEVQNR